MFLRFLSRRDAISDQSDSWQIEQNRPTTQRRSRIDQRCACARMQDKQWSVLRDRFAKRRRQFADGHSHCISGRSAWLSVVTNNSHRIHYKRQWVIERSCAPYQTYTDQFEFDFRFLDNSKVLINRIALLPRPNRVILVGILELGHTLRQRGIMQASDVAQLFGPHLYRPLERIKLSDSDYQQTLTILNPGLIHLIENYDAEKMAKLSEDFEASSEYLDRDYLYEVVYDGTCRAWMELRISSGFRPAIETKIGVEIAISYFICTKEMLRDGWNTIFLTL